MMSEHRAFASSISFPALYVITDEAAISPHGIRRSHEEIAKAAAEGGASIVQIRDKSASTRQLIEVTLRCKEIVQQSNILVFVNDRLDVALAAEADGVHLGDEDMPVGVARNIAGNRLLIGASVASVEEARAAQEAGADYVSVGAIYHTDTKPDAGAPIGCEPIRRIKATVHVPVAAIGGINRENILAVVKAGADMICVVSAVTRAIDMTAAVRELVEKMRSR